MKKFLVLIALVCLFMCTVEVDAACAYGANVGDEFVCLVAEATQGNSKGTAYPENGTLVLKNYNGGSISYSSGLGNPVAPVTIKLVGDNYIDTESSFGLRVPLTGVEFVGNGTLTIRSRLAIATIDIDRPNQNVQLNNNVNTIKILAGDKVRETKEVSNNKTEENKIEKENVNTDDKTENENVSTDDKTANEGFDWSLILVLVCCGVSVVCLLMVGTMLLTRKKDK